MTAATAVLERLERRLDELRVDVGQYGPRSVPAELRRDHLLTAASVEFVDRGFHGASMEQIAAQAGVTKPVLYTFFGSKIDLFAAVIDRVSTELAAALTVAVEPDDHSRLRAGVRAYLEYSRGQDDLWGAMLAGIAHGPVADALRRMRDLQVGLVIDALSRGHRAAGLDADEREITALAHLIVGGVQSVGNWWSDQPDISLDELSTFIEAALAPGLAALRGEHADVAWFPTRHSPT